MNADTLTELAAHMDATKPPSRVNRTWRAVFMWRGFLRHRANTKRGPVSVAPVCGWPLLWGVDPAEVSCFPELR